jgi:microcin C transport system permease protein
MPGYIARRLLLVIPTIFGIMLVTFVIVQFAPGGPIEHVLSQLDGSDRSSLKPLGGTSNAPSH